MARLSLVWLIAVVLFTKSEGGPHVAQPLNSDTQPLDSATPRCSLDASWQYHNGFCYYPGPSPSDDDDDPLATWEAAEGLCAKDGGHLASIHSHEEEHLIRRMVELLEVQAWVGLRSRFKDYGPEWSDKTAVDLHTWTSSFHPELYLSPGLCAAVTTKKQGLGSGTLYMAPEPCDIPMRFICKRADRAADFHADVAKVEEKEEPAAVVGACESGWLQFEDQCYSVPAFQEANFATWAKSQEMCQDMGANLATILSHPVQAFLTAEMEFESSDVWIGLSNEQSSPNFTWIDGSFPNYTNWGIRQPNGFPGSIGEYPASCVALMTIRTEAGKWFDESCYRELPSYCQKPVDPALTPPPDVISLCREGYASYFEDCFKFVSKGMTFDDAEDECVKDMAHLASVKDAYQEAFIETLMYENQADSAWIGLQARGEDELYTWTDGWPVHYSTWGPGQPSRDDGGGCVETTVDGHWNDVDCSKSQPYVCKYTDTMMPTAAPTMQGYCNPGWEAFGQHCYLFLTLQNQARPWSDAEFDCLRNGGTLLTVHNADENAFIVRHLMGRSRRRRQIRDDDFGEDDVPVEEVDMWMGVIRNADGGFQYVNGDPVNYANWGTGEPYDADGSDCVAMRPDQFGHWAALPCDTNNQYACKRSMIPLTTTPGRVSGTTRESKGTTREPEIQTTGMPVSGGLSPGAIAGIVIVSVAGVAILGGIGAWFYMSRKKKPLRFENELDVSNPH